MKKKQKQRIIFNTTVFDRDGYSCKFCECTTMLDAHHITDRKSMPNGGYVKENGITLCAEHHMDAEQFHISGGTEWVENMHPNDLYKLIGSSYELALTKSNRLG
jgi:hypothetical protein